MYKTVKDCNGPTAVLLMNVLDSLWDSLEPDTDKVVENVHLLLSTKNSNALLYQYPIDGTKYFL